MRTLFLSMVVALASVLFGIVGDVNAATEKVLHSFEGIEAGDGYYPFADLSTDSSGSLYGTTAAGGWAPVGDFRCPSSFIRGCGTVFELNLPHVGGTWSERVIYAFKGGNDGADPAGAVIKVGKALYGTTYRGGSGCSSVTDVGCGVVFKLTPPAVGGGAWTETVIYDFKGIPDGASPMGGLVADSTGALYGTTNGGGTGNCIHSFTFDPAGCGTVFKLTPPSNGRTQWNEAVIHTFDPSQDPAGGELPVAGLLMVGNRLYGTTGYGGVKFGGTVFELASTDGQKTWKETVLYSFRDTVGAFPDGALIKMRGKLYGTADGGGTCTMDDCGGIVFELTPPSIENGSWTEATLYSFDPYNGGAANPRGRLMGIAGQLFGITVTGGNSTHCYTRSCGTVFKLSPPASANGAWTARVLHKFAGARGDGGIPSGGLVKVHGTLYGSTEIGGDSNNCGPFPDYPGCGTVFSIKP